jgi:hypothetical protein
MYIEAFPTHNSHRSVWVTDGSLRPKFPVLGQVIGLGYQGITDNSVASLGFGKKKKRSSSKKRSNTKKRKRRTSSRKRSLKIK